MGFFWRKTADQESGQPVAAGLVADALEPPILCRGETRPEVIARLEVLDDVIFAAIDGDAAALKGAADAWKGALSELGRDTLEETRRQYLRHAQSVWDSLRHQSIQPPHRIFAAIEVIGLLVNHES